MKLHALYPLLLSWVLFTVGCSDETPPPPVSPSVAVPERPASTVPARTILFLGNSLSAGLGVDPEQAFPALIQQKIDSLGWAYRVVNAGESGLTTAGGLSRIEWLLRQKVDVLVLELGGNDGLRGIPPEVTRRNLKAIIEKTRATYPDVRVVLAGMQVPPNLGADYTEAFRTVFPALTEELDVSLIPFLLEGVGGIPDLNQPDGIHPTAAGHRIVAETVWRTLRTVLEPPS